MTKDKYSTNLSVGKSRNGRGIFTCKKMSVGQIILRLYGSLITCNEDDDLDDITRSNTIRYSKNKFLSPQDELGDYLNHACNPNAYIFKKGKFLYLKASENIPADSEILIDYSTIIGDDDSWTMKCNCGNKNCRKIIGKFNALPTRIQDSYLSLKMVPSYIYRHGR